MASWPTICSEQEIVAAKNRVTMLFAEACQLKDACDKLLTMSRLEVNKVNDLSNSGAQPMGPSPDEVIQVGCWNIPVAQQQRAAVLHGTLLGIHISIQRTVDTVTSFIAKLNDRVDEFDRVLEGMRVLKEYRNSHLISGFARLANEIVKDVTGHTQEIGQYTATIAVDHQRILAHVAELSALNTASKQR